jgi:hypothetical protein
MFKQIRFLKVLAFFGGLFFLINNALSQDKINNGTRAVFIFDIAKYIDYGPGFSDSSVFRIGILNCYGRWATLQKPEKQFRINLFS